jgi:hypothetical protein
MAIAERYYSIVSRSKYSEANTTKSKRYGEKHIPRQTLPLANTTSGKHYDDQASTHIDPALLHLG